MIKRIIWKWVFLLLSVMMYGQDVVPKAILEHLNEKRTLWDLEKEDISNVRISDQYTDSKTRITYYFVEQAVNGIPIDRSLTTVVVTPKGTIHSSGHGFFRNIHSRLKSSLSNIISKNKSINLAATSMGIELPTRLHSSTSRWKDIYTYSSENYEEEILIEKVYVMDQNGQFVLSWKVFMDDPNSSDSWEVFIDAITGEKISSYNHTIYCNHPLGNFSHTGEDCHISNTEHLEFESAPEAEYLVYALPLVDPREGLRTIENDGQFPDASPMGWHTASDDGSFRTITRGNNVHAYEDSDDNNMSINNEPDGGSNLSFNFNLDLNAHPQFSQDAAITNLFYTNNMAHDLFYILGFNEVAGNFQDNNFGQGGLQGDYVRAEGLDGEDIGNANFLTRPDGQRGRMQMYLFSNFPGILQIEHPSSLAYLDFEVGVATFGQDPDDININAEVSFSVTNDQENPTEGCSSIVNDVKNKIALIDRGGCDFSAKVLNAQQAGAVMALVCNIQGVNGGSGEELLNMGAGEGAEQVNIPSFFLKKSDCDIIKTIIRDGQSVVMSAREREGEGPKFLDSSYDNGVIIHEYAHGVSNRLTGGPSNTGCLPNSTEQGEQMGEGWSDFFGLIFTTKVGDTGDMPRGYGTYLTKVDSDEGGFREFPYSTDMDFNPLTYDDIKTKSVPHGVGAVWASILWDMYWAMIDLYGFNPDWTDTSSGNFKAAFLVMEGMKLQPCRPGFVDGRDAILEADFIHNGGVHEKLIWEAFARRGVGMNTDQGFTNDNRDGTEDFTVPPLLIEELKIEKSVSKFVDPGENYEVNLTVINHIPTTQSGVTVIDELPEGTDYVNGSGNIEPEVAGNILIFSLDAMDYLEKHSITYQINSDPDNVSVGLYYDDVEGASTTWTSESRQGSNPWARVTKQSLSGERSWYIEETPIEEVDQLLVSPFISVTGSNPVLRFWHRYEIVGGVNGGYIEISMDGGIWEKVDEKFIIRNEYPGELAFSTFAIPSLQGFSGTTENQWIDSYIDLNDYTGQDIKVRFRFGNEGELVSKGDDPGWFIDDIELMDLRSYSSSACVHSDQDPIDRCTENKTIIVNTSNTTSNEPVINYNKVNIYPNPAVDIIMISSESVLKGHIQLQSLDGKLLKQTTITSKNIQLDVSEFQSGMYFLIITNQENQMVEKIFIRN